MESIIDTLERIAEKIESFEGEDNLVPKQVITRISDAMNTVADIHCPDCYELDKLKKDFVTKCNGIVGEIQDYYQNPYYIFPFPSQMQKNARAVIEEFIYSYQHLGHTSHN
jgi:hypothetical protein